MTQKTDGPPTADPNIPYRGRFAPTPSGPLHMGSLLAAIVSHFEARSRGGRWLLRIDDLDGPRCPAGTSGRILRQLAAHGLEWDEAVRYQSRHVDAYRAALRQLADGGRLYACRCTRAVLAARSPAGPDGPVYPGTCAGKALPDEHAAIRFAVEDRSISLQDPWQGTIRRALKPEVGDFVVRRRDGQIAYQLACVVDEQAQHVTDVVRGTDLIGSSLRQYVLAEALGLAPRRYSHFPVLLGEDGRKLSKQNHAAAIEEEQASANLFEALLILGQAPPGELRGAPVGELVAWGCAHWQAGRIPAGPDIRRREPYNAVQQNATAPS